MSGVHLYRFFKHRYHYRRAGGFRYLTSMGDPKGTETAKNTLTYAVLGLVLIIGAWFILQFIEEFTGVKVTEFEIPKDNL